VNRESGARRIFFYNWPIYVGTWLGALTLGALATRFPVSWAWVGEAAAFAAVAWSLASLAVSHYIYDRSELVAGGWVAPMLPGAVQTWIAIHAGLDGEIDWATAMPGTCAARLDIYDAGQMNAGSIRRARRRTPAGQAATPASLSAFPIASAACDAVVVAFTAHEIRDLGARERFFGEVARVLRPGGRMLLVEHVRDFFNFAAFGPGFLHFLARGEWLRLAGVARLAVAAERRVTPWVVALALEKRR